MDKKNKGKKLAADIVIVCLAGSSIFSGYKAYDIVHSYKVNQEEYDNLSKKVERQVEETNENKTRIDFAKLERINPDVEGWIKYKDTHIDYPIVQGENNSKYLNESFEGNPSSFGTLFIDAGCNEPFEDFITIIYGHHMKNGSMFGDLEKLKDEEYYKKHPELELYTEDKDCNLEICAFLLEPGNSELYNVNIYDPKEKEDYINMIQELALYKTETEVTPNDKLVVLSTCAYEYENARYLVVCKLVEKTKYYSFKEPKINDEKVLVRKRLV